MTPDGRDESLLDEILAAKEKKMTPHEQVKQEIKELYAKVSEMKRGPICIYPDLARHLNQISKEVAKLHAMSLDPSCIIK